MLRVLALLSFLVLGGCAALSPNVAVISLATSPISAGPSSSSSKTGEAICWNALGLVAWGDCSVEAAKKAGGISQVSTVDQKNLGILGIVYRATVVVKGS